MFQGRPVNLNGSALRIIRDRQARYGDVVVPRNVMCPACRKYYPVTRMPRIRGSALSGPVMDCMCHKCHADNGKDLVRLCRIVCLGCKEVVALVEPGVEKSGFVWKEGGMVHVTTCPSCSSRIDLPMSPIVEKLAFYNANRIPYETCDLQKHEK